MLVIARKVASSKSLQKLEGPKLPSVLQKYVFVFQFGSKVEVGTSVHLKHSQDQNRTRG